MKKLYVVLLFQAFLALFATTVSAQTQSKSVNEEARLEGTYEIIQKGKTQEVFTTEILAEIEKRRDDTKEILWDVSPYTTIRIFPRSQMKSPAPKGGQN